MASTRQAKVLLDDFTFTESPRWHDGALWFSDFHDGLVLRIDRSGKAKEIVRVPGEPSGLGWLPDGRLLVVSMQNRQVMRLDPEGLKLYADLSDIATWHCNDMVVAADGSAYVGNFGAAFDPDEPPTPANLARIAPDGSVHVAAEDMHFPNGMVITPDGKTLLVAETAGGRVSAFDIQPDGALANRRVWAEVEGGPDGMALDAEGRVWVALPVEESVLRVEEGGRVCDRVAVTADLPTACMLGGPDRKTLYITTAINAGPEELRRARASRIETVEVDVPGAGLP